MTIDQLDLGSTTSGSSGMSDLNGLAHAGKGRRHHPGWSAYLGGPHSEQPHARVTVEQRSRHLLSVPRGLLVHQGLPKG